MKRWALALALVVLAAFPARAVTFQPTVNPLLPVQNSPIASFPVRNNFQSTYNDLISVAALIDNSGGGGGGVGTVTSVSCSPTAPVTCTVNTNTSTPQIVIGFPINGASNANVQMELGATTSGHAPVFDAFGNLVDSGGTGGGSVTWPSSGTIVISSGTNTPTGLAEVDGSCAVGSAGAWVAGSCGSGSGVSLSSTTSSIAYPLGFTTTTSGSLSTLFGNSSLTYNPSTKALSIGSAGTYQINGTQITCSALSNGATGCSTATGTSGATIALNNGANTFSGNITHSGQVLFTGAIPAMSGGQLALGSSTTAGGLIVGDGSTNDITIENSAGTSACVIGHAATTLNCTGLQVAGTAVLTANQSITLSGVVTGSGTTAITSSFGTFSSSTLATALTDETGTGVVVFSASPTFTGTISGANAALTGTTTMNNLTVTGTCTGCGGGGGGGTGTTGQVAVFSGTNTISGSTALFQSTSTWLGISTTTPAQPFDSNGGAYSRVVVGGTQSSGGTYTPNFNSGNSVTLTFGAGNLTVANPTNITAGFNYIIGLTQDAVGGRTVTWGSDFKWGGGVAPTLSTAAAAKDILSCWADTSSTLECTLAIVNAK